MDVTAIITAFIGAGIAVLSMIQTSRLSKREAKAREAENVQREQAEERLRQLEVDLDAIRGEQAARISYEYEARKRLYAEVGALQFQLGEAAEDARQRVLSLARTARKGALDPQTGWLARDEYYLRTTVYYLFAPLGLLRLIQRRLTAIDLGLDERVKAQYLLLRVLSWSFSEGHDVAAAGERLTYAPAWDDLACPEEPVCRPQHLPLGNIAKPVEALVADGDSTNARVLSYGEFVQQLDEPDSEVGARFRDTDPGDINPFRLFLGFHPERRPVLWRILVYQLMLYEALINLARDEDVDVARLERYFDPDDAAVHSCRWMPDQPLYEARVPFEAARQVLLERLANVRDPLRTR